MSAAPRVDPLASLTRFAKRNWFIIGIFLVVTLGFVASGIGRKLNPGSVTTNTIVVIQFLILGFTVPTDSLMRGLAGWRFHVVVQLAIFVGVPLFFLLTSLPLRGAIDPGLMVGIVALAVLPTTVSSCVVFTQLAGGNVAGAMFNSVLANAAGVIVSPLLLSLLLSGSGQGLPPEQMMAVFVDLAGKMLAPAAVGQLLRLRSGALCRQEQEPLRHPRQQPRAGDRLLRGLQVRRPSGLCVGDRHADAAPGLPRRRSPRPRRALLRPRQALPFRRRGPHRAALSWCRRRPS